MCSCARCLHVATDPYVADYCPLVCGLTSVHCCSSPYPPLAPCLSCAVWLCHRHSTRIDVCRPKGHRGHCCVEPMGEWHVAMVGVSAGLTTGTLRSTLLLPLSSPRCALQGLACRPCVPMVIGICRLRRALPWQTLGTRSTTTWCVCVLRAVEGRSGSLLM